MATDLTEGKLQTGRGQKAQLSAYKIRSKGMEHSYDNS